MVKKTPKTERFKLHDKVFYKLAGKYLAMTLIEITTEDNVKYGLCTWPNLETGRGVFSEKYKLSDLTKIPPLSNPPIGNIFVR